METGEWGIVALTLAGVLFLILRKRLLKPNAILIGLGTGIYTAYLGGLPSFFAIILFFLMGEFVTRRIRDQRTKKPHEVRSTINIVGNIGPALIGLTLNPVMFSVMFFASLSAAFADTLSSEIGVLSKTKPLRITTLKTAEPGEDGAVSLLGFGGAFIGSLAFGSLAFVITQDIYWGLVILVAGMAGTVLDSFIG
ncbi:MAG: DUF92 domain-containing protein, partial [archaeon]